MSEGKKGRATRDVAQRRVEDALQLILDGGEVGWGHLCDYVREMESKEGSVWHLADGEKPLSYSQIRRYAVKAEKLIAESCRASRKRLLRLHRARRRNLYAKAVEQGDTRSALAVLRDLAELEGLYPSKKAEVTGKNGGPVVLHVTEEIIGREAPINLDQIEEEIVGHDGSSQSGPQENPPPPDAGDVPAI